MSRLAVIGPGYVGLVTSATLARLGHDVCYADIVPEKVALLSRGEIPMVESGLDQMVREDVTAPSASTCGSRGSSTLTGPG